jgi:hypothetical protein
MEGTQTRQVSFGAEVLRGELVTQGFSLIDHSVSLEQVDELIEAYADFTDNLPDPDAELLSRMLPAEPDPRTGKLDLDVLDYAQDGPENKWHKLRTNTPYWAKPNGYTNRSQAVRALHVARDIVLPDDPKEFYHFTPDTWGLMRAQHDRYGWGPIPDEVQKLHKKFSAIHYAAREAVRSQLALLEERDRGLLGSVVTPRDLMKSPLRLLFYHPGQGEILAGGHFDKSVATLQIAESHLGLRILDPIQIEGDWRTAPANEHGMHNIIRPAEKGAFFTGLNYRESAAFPDGDLIPAWHDVINRPELNDRRTLHGKNVARWALIFFVNSELVGVPDKAKTHGAVPVPLQAA